MTWPLPRPYPHPFPRPFKIPPPWVEGIVLDLAQLAYVHHFSSDMCQLFSLIATNIPYSVSFHDPLTEKKLQYRLADPLTIFYKYNHSSD